MDFKKFFSELKRRNVYKVAIAYAITAWLLAQIVALSTEVFEAPIWVMKIIILILGIGFPISLILAWAFEMSPQGMIRTTSVAAKENPYSSNKKKPLTSNLFIGMLLFIIASQFIYNKYQNSDNNKTIAIEKTIAVLPFRNDSPNEENLYFCNGIMDGILDHLSKLSELRVVSRTSVEQFRENPPSLKTIAEELGVNYLVEGSVQRIDNNVVIFAQLIYAEDDKRLWSQKYSEDITELFAVQADVTRSIADKLEAVISPKAKEQIETIPTRDVIAYDYYLQGNEFRFNADINIQSYEDWEKLMSKAKLFYEQAIERDSSLAEAYNGLGFIEMDRNGINSLLNKNYLDQVLVFANKAINLNPNLYESYLLKGNAYLRTNQYLLANKNFEKARDLSPNDLFSLFNLAYISMRQENDYLKTIKILKKIESVITNDRLWDLYRAYFELHEFTGDRLLEEEYIQKCIEVDPDGLIWGWFYTSGNRLDEALDFNNKRFPEENQYKLATKGLIYLMKGDYETALNKYEKWEVMVNTQKNDDRSAINDWHRYGQALILTGNSEKGMQMIQKQIELYEQHIELSRIWYINTYYDLAGIYAFLGDTEKVYYWLEKFEEENGWLKYGALESFIQFDFQFDNIRNEERFKNILKRGVKQKEIVRKEIREYLALIDSNATQ